MEESLAFFIDEKNAKKVIWIRLNEKEDYSEEKSDLDQSQQKRGLFGRKKRDMDQAQ